MHEDLKYAGMLPPLDAPHHLRSTEWCKYREGVTIERHTDLNRSVVDIGLEKVWQEFIVLLILLGFIKTFRLRIDHLQNALVNGQLMMGARVTICLEKQATLQSDDKYYQGRVTSPLGRILNVMSSMFSVALIPHIQWTYG